MPFENPPAFNGRRIAVIGGGISGMGAAHLLSADHSVTLFEAEKRLGGHARTVLAGKRGDQPVDTGFIVFNKPNYPHLSALFEKLNVPVVESDMSFGASVQGGRIEYGLANLNAVLAQKSNLLRPGYLRMLRDVLRFNARALDLVADDMTIARFLDRLGTGDWFRDYYLLPLSGAIWSTPTQGILDFPARAMIEFFRNHALLSTTGQHQWYTVQGGSIQYVSRLAQALERSGVDMRLGAATQAVRRTPLGVEVKTAGQDWQRFDDVVFATHADDTLSLLSDATPAERASLGDIGYQDNCAILHADPSVMPRRKACWSSWVYTEPATGPQKDRIDLTYWMNSLQPIPKDDPLFVTLNTERAIDESLIHDEVTFRHPVYTLAALRAQERIRQMNGQNGTWYCGAWMKNGFHEDGLSSAVDVVQRMAAGLALAAE